MVKEGGERGEGGEKKQRLSELHQHDRTEWHGYIFQHQAQSKYQCANLSTSFPSSPDSSTPHPPTLSISPCVQSHGSPSQ